MIEKVEDNELYFAKIRPTAKIPTKKAEDAGYDLYADFEEEYMAFLPHETKAVPTGIATAFSPKYYAQLEERSSTGKFGLKRSGGVIDSGYRGEYMVMIYNSHDKPLLIAKPEKENLPETIIIGEKEYKSSECVYYPYSKAVCQIVMHKIPAFDEKEIPYEDLIKISSERGTGRFGSSNK